MLEQGQLESWDRESFFHPNTHLGQFVRKEAPQVVMKSGEGVYVYDSNDNKLLDGFAGLYCVNVGYGRQPVIDAISEQAQKLAYYHAYFGHGTEASITLSKMVLERAPKHMSKIYFGVSGSDANDTNIKLTWHYQNILGRPQKKKIISRWRAYHGSGLMSGSLTGLDAFHKKFDLPLPMVKHTTAPYYYRRPAELENLNEEEFSAHCAEELEALIASEGADTIAAMVAEPALGTGGLVPPPKGYWEAITPILKQHDILLIADEVVTGFGRLGSMFASPFYGLEPDFMTIAKGVTSAYLPLSGSLISGKVYDVLMQGTDDSGPIGHGWTYSAHPICAAAGVANLKLIDEMNIVANTAEVGPYLLKELQSALGDHPNVGEIRGEGLLAAVELVEEKAGRKFFDPQKKVGPTLAAKIRENGVIVRAMAQGDILGMAPPLCLSREEADVIVKAIHQAVTSYF